MTQNTLTESREFNDHDGTYVTIGCAFSNNKNHKRKIWDYKRADYLLMEQKISETEWVNLITGASDIHGAVTVFTSIILKIASTCIPTREVIIRNDDKVWFDSTLRREIRIRDRFRKTFLRVKSVLTESKYKQQRNKVNNLKKQAKKKFYANINENLDELKSANGKLYWKTMNMLIKNEISSNETPPLSDPQNDFKLSYESIEKAEI